MENGWIDDLFSRTPPNNRYIWPSYFIQSKKQNIILLSKSPYHIMYNPPASQLHSRIMSTSHFHPSSQQLLRKLHSPMGAWVSARLPGSDVRRKLFGTGGKEWHDLPTPHRSSPVNRQPEYSRAPQAGRKVSASSDITKEDVQAAVNPTTQLRRMDRN